MIIGLGSDIIDIRRIERTFERFGERFERFQPFPYDRHDGRGFDRNDEVDLEAMKKHYEPSTNGHHAEIDEQVLAPADDN